MKRFLTAAAGCLCLALSTPARAEYPAELDKGMKLDLGDPSRFLRIIVWDQIWLRYVEQNPGSIIRGSVRTDGLDIGVRSSRLLLHAQLTKDLLFLFHAGINGQSTVGGGFGLGADAKKPQIFVHEVAGEYRVLGEHLALGGGLHYWNGVSRMASTSTFSLLTLDAPIYNWATLDKTDQLARQLGVYAKGHLGALEYRVALNHPFAAEGTPGQGKADYYAKSDTWAAQGYFKLDFLDKESNTLPYYAGTYLGKKRVWNAGAGFYYHPDSMAYLDTGLRVADTVIAGLDTFAELPLGEGSAFTLYANGEYQSLGPSYVRNIGIMNPSSGLSKTGPRSFNGAGNAVPTIGTGMTYYGHAGYLLPDVLGRAGQLQPYVSVRWSQLEGLGGPVVVPEAGVNWLIAGQHAKVTLHYRSRPVFVAQTSGKPVERDRKSEVTLQLQFMY